MAPASRYVSRSSTTQNIIIIIIILVLLHLLLLQLQAFVKPVSLCAKYPTQCPKIYRKNWMLPWSCCALPHRIMDGQFQKATATVPHCIYLVN